jgi:hypothetical protein
MARDTRRDLAACFFAQEMVISIVHYAIRLVASLLCRKRASGRSDTT